MNVYLNEAATGHCSPVTVDRSQAITYMSGENSDHIGPSGVRLIHNGEMQNGDNDLKNVRLKLLCSLCVCNFVFTLFTNPPLAGAASLSFQYWDRECNCFILHVQGMRPYYAKACSRNCR